MCLYIAGSAMQYQSLVASDIKTDTCKACTIVAFHPPQVSIDGPLNITARPDEEVRLVGKVSDPDGNPVSIKWWAFQVVGSYEGEVSAAIPASASTTVAVAVPANAIHGQTIHMILEASDNAPLPLTRYQRVIITVK
jgi:hypothetical protein